MPQIDSIHKDDRYNPYERILYVCGGGRSLLDVPRWSKSQQQVIAEIDSGIAYWVSAGLLRVDVEVARSPYGNKYIKTKADPHEPNNLLNLPEC